MTALISAHSAQAVLQPLGLVLDVRSSSLTLDEARAPYADGDIECAMPAASVRNLIDLRSQEFRIELLLRQDFGKAWSLSEITTEIGGSMAGLTALLAGQPLGSLTNRYHRPFNGSAVIASQSRRASLRVTDRAFNDKTATLRISATSRESRLIDDALIATTPLDPGTTSLREICRRVLARHGEVLSADVLDATVAEVAATIWHPGVGAWEYLNPMLEAASLRLWCDELGRWHLTPRQSTTQGAVTLNPKSELTGLVDRMTIDAATWYDAVVVEYRWVDEHDLNRVEYDIAGANPPRSVRRVLRDNTRYPGPGAAAGLLDRARGRGRILDVQALSNYNVSPGMPATITPPDTEAQTGYVSAVTLRFPDDEMDVTTRGLVDTPRTAWAFVPAGIKWSDAPTGLSWSEYTPEGI